MHTPQASTQQTSPHTIQYHALFGGPLRQHGGRDTAKGLTHLFDIVRVEEACPSRGRRYVMTHTISHDTYHQSHKYPSPRRLVSSAVYTKQASRLGTRNLGGSFSANHVVSCPSAHISNLNHSFNSNKPQQRDFTEINNRAGVIEHWFLRIQTQLNKFPPRCF